MTIYRQRNPDPGRTDLREIEIVSVTEDIVRFRPYPAEGETLLKIRTCDTWAIKYFWTFVSGDVVQHRRRVRDGVYIDA